MALGPPNQPPRPQFTPISAEGARMSVLLWGGSGCGKTTLCATAPMECVWIQFDPNGVNSLTNYPHLEKIHKIDLVPHTPNTLYFEFQNDDPFSIKAKIKQHPAIRTMIVDSATMMAEKVLEVAVTRSGGTSTFDVPGINGWAVRNQMMRRMVSRLMQIAAANDLHFILTTHEHETLKEGGGVQSVTLSLSQNLANEVALRFSEVWHMEDVDGVRMIYTRPYVNYKPMKTRMFLAPDNVVGGKFRITYDADAWTGDGIAEWWQRWMDNKGKKIPLPKGGVQK